MADQPKFVEAKVLADSISHDGDRLTTMQVTGHRFILAEFNTHRRFSRNSASSRAIPLRKQLERVRENPAVPVSWPAEQKGMQGGDEVADVVKAEEYWHMAAAEAAIFAEALGDAGVHKSIANRVLEPFMWHTIVVTSTEWQNFFDQRCSPLAQPEIRVLAEKMREVYEASQPVLLHEHEWHTPYIQEGDYEAAMVASLPLDTGLVYRTRLLLAKISAARCARVSYLTQEGKRDITEDLRLYQRLVSAEPPHWSPLEHVATPWKANKDTLVNMDWYRSGMNYVDPQARRRPPRGAVPRVGNLTGWRSLRIEEESEPVR